MPDIKIVIGADISELQRQAAKAGVTLKQLAVDSTVPFSALTSTINKATASMNGAVAINKKLAEESGKLAEKNRLLKENIQGAIDKISALHNAARPAAEGIKIFGKSISDLLPALVGPTAITIGLSAAAIAVELFSQKAHQVDLKPLAAQLAVTKKEEQDLKTAIDAASESVVSQAKDIGDLRDILVSTTSEIKSITAATINQGLAAFLFDKKNIAVQKELTAEIQKQLKVRKQNNPFAGTEFVPGIFSKDKNTKAIAEAKAEIIGINQLSEGLGGIFEKLVDGNKKSKAIKDIRTISDVIKELKIELDTLNTRGLNLGTDEGKNRVRVLEDTIKELSTKFGPAGKSAAQSLYDGFNSQLKQLDFTIGLKPELLLQKLKDNLQTKVKGQEFKITPIIAIEPIIKKGVFEERLAEFLLNKEAFQKKVDEFNDLVNTSLATIGSNALSNLGDAIAGALTGKPISGLFDSIFVSVGDQIQQLGKFLIKSGIQIKLAKEAFKKLLASPIASIAVGIGLVALGALIKAAVNNKPKGFATGSRSTPGGTFMVGERGPERIFLPQGSRVQPNNEVTAYGGGNNRIEIFGRLQGDDIVLSSNRTQRTWNRNN